MTLARSVRRIARRLLAGMRQKIHRTFGNIPLGGVLLSRYRVRSLDAYILSFPKCGRTWVRMMLGKALQIHFGLPESDFLGSNYLVPPAPGIPVVKLSHDKTQLKAEGELNSDKKIYKDVKVILLVRDLRDVIVSCYFQAKYRTKTYGGDLSSFVRSAGRPEKFLSFYNTWAENRHVPRDFLLVRYEDLHADTEGRLRRLSDFLGLTEIADSTIREAVKYASFENMRRIELAQPDDERGKLRATDKSDAESFKTRRGRIGGFVDYLNEPDINYLNEKLRQLASCYGY